MKPMLSITRKELNNYFSSPLALIFVGVFLVITLFTFFWAATFFARGIADVRPLFNWMPILMIFLIGALTMRQWSEETQTGTLEILLTMPVKIWQLVLGKFAAVLLLVMVALLLTLALPVTVASLGNLDFGPVIGGYLAAVLMAAAYAAIGLFISSRTNNQIVALILTVIVCGVFYLIGSPTITQLVPPNASEILRAMGTGSRFESIERGVIDLRDLIYYMSITLGFLSLNILSLNGKRWSRGAQTRDIRLNGQTTAALIVANLIVFNVLIFPFKTVRLDLTANQEYTLAPVTVDLMQSLNEPLLVRGYFSEETHPALAPILPLVRDTLQEYQVIAGDRMQLEFVDPLTNPEAELEANQTYGIQPTPLQFSGRGGTSLVNAYINILIRYGDQVTLLNLLDLIEVQDVGGELQVRLRNLEYDLTSSIQRVVFGFQSLDAVLAALDEPAQLTLYVTPDTLPEDLADAPARVQSVADEVATQSNGKFVYELVNLSDPNTQVDLQELSDQFQIRPIAADIFGQQTFYLHMVLQVGDQLQVIYPTGTLSETEIRTTIESALKRSSSGFLEVVGVWTPPAEPQFDQFSGQQIPSLQQYETVVNSLRENYEVRPVSLAEGEVPADLDVLIVIGPQNLTDIDRYAIDQFLMRGGSVLVAGGTYQIAVDPAAGAVGIVPVAEGLQDMLAHYGVTIGQQIVVDTQNQPFPVPQGQNLVSLVDYPAFVDVRPDGMARDILITSNLPALTVSWASPITLDEALNADRTVSVLLRSTSESKVTNIPPGAGLDIPYPADGETASQVMAVAITGAFSSYFNDRPSPFGLEVGAEATPDPLQPPAPAQPSGFINTSPDTARLVVVSSSEFLNDNIFQLSTSIGNNRATQNAVEFIANSIDWFTEDPALASIRSSGATARLLQPLTEAEQSRWEIGNYVFAVISLLVLGGVWQLRRRVEPPMELELAEPVSQSTMTTMPSTTTSEGEAQ